MSQNRALSNTPFFPSFAFLSLHLTFKTHHTLQNQYNQHAPLNDPHSPHLCRRSPNFRLHLGRSRISLRFSQTSRRKGQQGCWRCRCQRYAIALSGQPPNFADALSRSPGIETVENAVNTATDAAKGQTGSLSAEAQKAGADLKNQAQKAGKYSSHNSRN